MRRFYELILQEGGIDLDPAEAARLEVEWWRVHRDGPEEELEDALVDLYAYLYDADSNAVRPAASKRAEAMVLSDRWVKAGRRRDDPLLAEERRALVASYAALRDAVEVRRGRL
jgi:hypothetical protein